MKKHSNQSNVLVYSNISILLSIDNFRTFVYFNKNLYISII